MTPIESWQTRFREKFGLFSTNVNKKPLTSIELESFISQERQQLIQEAVELGEGLKVSRDFMEMTVDPVKRGIHNAAITAYQEKLKELV